MEHTLVIIKPDGVARGLIGEIIGRYEKKGLSIVAAKLLKADREILEKHYEEHHGRPYFDTLVKYMMESSIMVMVVNGERAVDIVRLFNGHKDPTQAFPGTIRGDFANSLTKNIVHASDSITSANREIGLWFPHFNF